MFGESCSRSLGCVLPASPASSITKATTEQAQDEQEDHRAYESIHDCGDDSRAKMNAEPRQQPIADKRSDETNKQITYQPEAAALHDAAGEPASNDSNQNDNEQTLIRQVHDLSPRRAVRLHNRYKMGLFPAPVVRCLRGRSADSLS